MTRGTREGVRRTGQLAGQGRGDFDVQMTEAGGLQVGPKQTEADAQAAMEAQ